MILSRTMRQEDYEHLVAEGQVIIDIQSAIQMWFDAQHKARLWEYAMAQKVMKTHFGDKKGLVIGDHGCGAGYLSPIMYWLGNHVKMYECWVFGNEEKFMMEQMRRVGLVKAHLGGTYQMINRPLTQMTDADRNVDAAFCISTLEHIGEYQWAFRDLLSTVKKGGLMFLTTDFAEREKDDYVCANLRAGKMFCERTYMELREIGYAQGFQLLGYASDWKWSEECRLVNDYGFASLAMIRSN